MTPEFILIATHTGGTHPDDECSCGTTGNGAKPATNAWFWRGANYKADDARRTQLRSLQDAIDRWAKLHPYPHELTDRRCVKLLDEAMARKDLEQAIFAFCANGSGAVQFLVSGEWTHLIPRSGFPSFDVNLQWRPAPPPKPKRPHADLIEKRLEDEKWSYRTPRNGSWLTHSTPAFTPDFEYKCEPAFTEKRKALVRDWLSGTEYEVKRSKGWEPADACDMLETDAEFLRKKPTTQKLRIRTAVMKSTVSGGLPFTMSATTGEQESYIASLKQFIRWMGPWQEVEVEAE